MTDGILSLGLPADGNKFSITVRSGSVTFFGGTVNTVSGAILQTGARRTYYKSGGDWTLLQTSSAPDAYNYVAANRALSVDDRYLWVNTDGAAVTLTIPADFPNGTVFDITRWGSNALFIATSGTEGVIDPATGTPDTTGAEVNYPGDVRFHKQGGHWAFISNESDTA